MGNVGNTCHSIRLKLYWQLLRVASAVIARAACWSESPVSPNVSVYGVRWLCCSCAVLSLNRNRPPVQNGKQSVSLDVCIYDMLYVCPFLNIYPRT